MSKRIARLSRVVWFGFVLVMLSAIAAFVNSLWAQSAVPPPPSVAGVDSVTIAPGPEYAAGGFHDFLFGANYRVFWTTPIRVPVLDLHRFAGGLKPKKKGGGMQTESLRFESKDGEEYTFRSVDKWAHLPGNMKGELARKIAADQVSSEHPAAALVAARLLDSQGILHATPQLVVMPHDTMLGEYSKEFAGRLGLIEISPGKTSHGEGFAGAVEIIDSDSLRKLLDSDGNERVDERALLRARLMDIFMNDIDRHPGQWKWARMTKHESSLWEPIPRDRDQAFVAYHGALLRVAHFAAPNLVVFDGDISIPGLTYNSLEMDRRLMSSLGRAVWDSVAAEVTAKLTNSVIEDAVGMMPREYAWSAAPFVATLELRRDHLARAAVTFYKYLSGVVDVHGTDAADRLTVTRVADGLVDVKLETRGGAPYFMRRFDARDTHEIRVYLHGGDDSAFVAGDVRSSISVKIIGGNGVNWLNDTSIVEGRRNPTELVENGPVEGVRYGKDTLMSRLPFVEVNGKSVPAGRDRGTQIVPIIGLRSELLLGVTPKIGFDRYSYAFRDRPYSSVVGAEAEYSMSLETFAVRAHADKRWEGTPFHVTANASVSQLALLSYHGLGNATSDSGSGYFSVRQRQWQFAPAVGYRIGETTDLSLGPILRYTSTDAARSPFVAATHPYGAFEFSQLGAQLAFQHTLADDPAQPRRRLRIAVTGTYYPAMMDVASAYEVVSAHVGSFVTIPVITDPVLVWRAGATKVFGTAPFFDDAFIGGNRTLRQTDSDRYAGDAALFVSSEFRIPLMSFAFMLPMRAGILATAEAGRVYVNSTSPGGWHASRGGGVWVGLANQSFIVTCTVTTDAGRKDVHCQTGLGL